VKVLVCGSRSWGANRDQVARVYDRVGDLPLDATILHGNAKGADRLAGDAAQLRGNPVEMYPADWDEHGRRAGIIRNLLMLDQEPDLVIAFWDGKSAGTKHTLTEAERRGIPVEIIRS
jgi:hypothetical protein